MVPSVLHHTHLQVCDNYIACDVHFPRSVAIKSSGSERVSVDTLVKKKQKNNYIGP